MSGRGLGALSNNRWSGVFKTIKNHVLTIASRLLGVLALCRRMRTHHVSDGLERYLLPRDWRHWLRWRLRPVACSVPESQRVAGFFFPRDLVSVQRTEFGDLCEQLRLSFCLRWLIGCCLQVHADFPNENAKMEKLLSSVENMHSVGVRLNAQMADHSGVIKSLIVRAEDARLLGHWYEFPEPTSSCFLPSNCMNGKDLVWRIPFLDCEYDQLMIRSPFTLSTWVVTILNPILVLPAPKFTFFGWSKSVKIVILKFLISYILKA